MRGISHLTAALDNAIDVTSASTITKQVDLVKTTGADTNCLQDLTQPRDLSTKSNSELSGQSLSTTSGNSLHDGDQAVSNKRPKVIGNIGNSAIKQQPHIIRHHPIPQAQSLEIVSSASQRPKSNETQSSPLATVSVTSSKAIVANSAQVLLSTTNCSDSSGEAAAEDLQIGKFSKIKQQYIYTKIRIEIINLFFICLSRFKKKVKFENST